MLLLGECRTGDSTHKDIASRAIQRPWMNNKQHYSLSTLLKDIYLLKFSVYEECVCIDFVRFCSRNIDYTITEIDQLIQAVIIII